MLQELLRKINELPRLKQQFVLIMLRLASVQEEKYKPYAEALCILLRNLINYDNNEMLSKLVYALESVLTSYFFDQNDLLCGQLNIEKYEPKHKILTAINEKVNYYSTLYYVNDTEIEEFKDKLYKV
jgi:hypothetical protein